MAEGDAAAPGAGAVEGGPDDCLERRAGGAAAFRERMPRRILLLRHGSRPDEGFNPGLDDTGHKVAAALAAVLTRTAGSRHGFEPIRAIYCSPFLRALQTAAPAAMALGMPLRVEWGFIDLLGRWLYSSDPQPGLRKESLDSLPMAAQIDEGYKGSVQPDYPECRDRMWPGDRWQRQKAIDRHSEAIRAALASAGGGSVLVVAHAATHDFVVDALCPSEHLEEHHTPFCVPHCSITEILEQGDDCWHVEAFGVSGQQWLEHLEEVADDPELEELYARQQQLGQLLFEKEHELQRKGEARPV